MYIELDLSSIGILRDWKFYEKERTKRKAVFKNKSSSNVTEIVLSHKKQFPCFWVVERTIVAVVELVMEICRKFVCGHNVTKCLVWRGYRFADAFESQLQWRRREIFVWGRRWADFQIMEQIKCINLINRLN